MADLTNTLDGALAGAETDESDYRLHLEEKYLRPSPDQIRAAREAVGHTQGTAGATVHVAARTWRLWEAGDRRMPLASWELYLIKTGQPERLQKASRNPAEILQKGDSF